MCCSNRDREKSVVALLTFGILVSLGVCVPMFIISYPGDECILFVSVRGEALVYGHPAGCHFISYSHCIVVIPTAIVVFVMFLCYNKRGPKDTGSISNRSLRGSLPGLSQSSYGIQTGVSSKLIIVVLTNALFVLITAIVNLSGYLVTCGQLTYETRRQVHQKTTLGIGVKNFAAECYSVYRTEEFHTRFHHDHYEFSGQWRGIELSLASSFLSAVVWLALFTILVLLRRNVKAKNRRHIVESIEDARIWASDMALSNSLPMKPINYAESANSGVSQLDAASIGKASIGKSLGSRLSSSALYAQSKHDSIGVNDIHHHQQVIANSHPNGSLFMTQQGQYVQLINGVLTNVSPPGSSNAGSVQYAEVQFPAGMPVNPAQPNYPQPPIIPNQNVMNSPQAAMMAPQNAMMAPQNAMMAPQNAMNAPQNAMNYPQFVANQTPAPMNPPQSMMNQTENVLTQIHNAMTQPPPGMTQPQAPASLDRVSQVSQPLLPQVSHVAGHVSSNQSPAPSVSHGSQLHDSRSQSTGEQEEDQYQEKTTKRDQRKQLDIAERAGIKCSQF